MKLSRQFWMAFALILLTGATVRFADLARQELWLDECCSVLSARSPEGLLQQLRTDNHPPLYLFTLRVWTMPFGIGEWGTRSLSVVAALIGVALMPALLLAIGFTRRAALFAMLYCALLPIAIHHSRDARPYAMLFTLAIATMWAWASIVCEAKASPRLDRRWWALVVFMVAGLYTHDLFMMYLPLLLVAATIVGTSWCAFRRLLVAEIAAAACYSPWLGFVTGQPKSQALAWVAATWARVNPAMLIPQSLEVFGIAPQLPPYLRPVPQQPAFQLLSVTWSVALAAVILTQLVRLWCNAETRYSARRILALVFLLVAPLLVVLGYSLALQPIYVVGRYDIIALPAWCALAGIATAWITNIGRRRLVPWLIATCLAAVMIWANVVLIRPLPRQGKFTTQRGQALAAGAKQQDLVLCFNQEGAKIATQMMLRGIDADLMTFPVGTRRHMGWIDPADMDPSSRERLRADAQRILGQFAGSSPRYHRVWLMLDPFWNYKPRPGEPANYSAEIANLFFTEAARAGLRPATEGLDADFLRKHSIFVLER